MAINAKRGSTHEPVPQGMFPARCYKIIHLGTIPDTYMGENKLTNKIRVDWELPTKTKVFDSDKGEQPISISKEYTLSMNEKANLCKDLESWRGKQFTDEEAEAFDISSIIGQACMINVAHKTSNSTGNIYSYVASVSPMPEGMDCPSAVNPPFIWDYDENFDLNILDNMHDFFKDKIRSSAEFAAKIDPPDVEDVPMPTEADDPGDGNDPLPF